MATDVGYLETEVLEFSADHGIRFQVEYRRDSFRPNRVSEGFARAIPKMI